MAILPRYLKARVAHWDDERSIGNSLIITLADGWEFGTDTFECIHVKGFDSFQDAKGGISDAIPCSCLECLNNLEKESSHNEID